MSTCPSRNGGRSSSPSALNRSVTPGASAASRVSSGAANWVMRASVARIVNRRSSWAGSSGRPAWNRLRLLATTWCTSSLIASAYGVGTSPRPARTRIGSPNACRILVSVRLVAGTDKCNRSAAEVTLCSSSSTSSAASRFKSDCVICK